MKKQNNHIMKGNTLTGDVLIANGIKYIPRISVILPVYNVGDYISVCMDSVLNQTLREIEVICIDDGSTDNSLDILRDYAARDNRITVISRENRGVGFSRNQGIDIARGKYLAFMDPDDYYPTNDVLEIMYNAAQKNGVKICGGSLIVYDNNRKIEIKKTEALESFDKDEIINYTDFQYDYGFQRYIYETSMVRENKIYFPEYIRFQDPVFMTQVFQCAGKFCALAAYTYAYRYSHKKINWTEERVAHLLYGLRDDLKFSVENKLDKLYALTLTRIKKDFKQILLSQNSDRISKTRQEIMDICLKYAATRYKNTKLSVAVSIVMPIYNAEAYLNECLDSIVNQTLKNLEIICVNDGSTDNSLNIIKEYAERDKRIKYIDKPNAGYGQTMNCGIALATGEYIGIVEPDDFIELDMYETLYKKEKSTDADIIKSNMILFTQNRDATQSLKYLIDSNFYGRVDTPYNLQNYMIDSCSTCSAIYKRKLLLDNDIKYNETPGAAYQDTSFWFKTHCSAKKMCVIDREFYNYRRDNPNSSIHNTKLGDSILYEYKSIYDFIKKNKKDKFIPLYFRRKFNGLFWYLGVLAPELKPQFISKIREAIYGDINAGIANTSLFTDKEIALYKKLISDDYINNFKYLYNISIPSNSNRAAVIELNDCHGECMPGYVQYLLNMGYTVDVFINSLQDKEEPLKPIFVGNDLVKIYSEPADEIIKKLRVGLSNLYNVIIFNSDLLYRYNFSATDLIKNQKSNTKILTVEHRQECIKASTLKNANIIVLKEFKPHKGVYEVNPHYFGKFPLHTKNKITEFITAGNIQSQRKNTDLLKNAVLELIRKNQTNFHVTVIGRGNIGDLPDEIKPFITLTGRLGYQDMYKKIAKADFFLTLLDPENPEHKRYIKKGTSGSFQLIYGLNIPPIIANMFSRVHNFTAKNSIIYNKNSDLTAAMTRAINMTAQEYGDIKKSLQETTDIIYKKSQDALKRAIKTGYKKYNTLTAYILFPYYWLRVMIYRHRLHKMSVPRVSCSRRAIMDLINRDHKDLTAAINNLNNQYAVLRSQIDAIKAVINKNTGMDKDSMLSFSLSELSRIPDQLETMVNILRNLDNKDIVADMLSIISQNMRQAVSDASAILAGHPENVNVYIEE